MSKFRRLSLAELQEVEPQFIRFLAVNGIDGAEWTRLKAEAPGEADKFLLQFSQTVFAGVIGKLEYLDQRSKRDYRTYPCGPDKISMNGLLIEGTTDLDLADETLPADEMMRRLRSSGASVKLYSGERAYREGDREQDIFLLMEQGALISDGSMFKLLEEVKN